jgi:hypothetical protein
VAPPSEAAAKERIAKWSANEKDDLGFAIETLDDPPVLVGNIGLWGARPKDRCATLGIALGREHSRYRALGVLLDPSGRRQMPAFPRKVTMDTYAGRQLLSGRTQGIGTR